MSRQTITEYYCDVCDKKTTEDARLVLNFGRHMNPAGSMDDSSDVVELCHKCSLHLLSVRIHEEHDGASKFFKQLTEPK